MKALPGDSFEDVVDDLALLEAVEKRRERAEIEGLGAGAEQVIADAGQLADDGADVLAARRQVDAHQLFDRVMPGDLVHDRRDVVHPIDDRDILVKVEIFAQLFEAAMKKADVRVGLDDGFAVEREDEAQGGVGRGMLRTEIQRPQVILLRSVAQRF